MAYTDMSAVFVYKGLLTYQQMDALGENDKYFKSGDPTVTGKWIYDQNADTEAIMIDSESTTYSAMQINSKYGLYIVQDISNGRGLLITRNLNEAGSASLVTLLEDHAASTQHLLDMQNDGQGYGINIVSNYVGGINFVARFFHDGNDANGCGVIMAVGTDDNSGTNIHCTFQDGNEDAIGNITSSGGTVAYNAFTGGHPSFERNDKEHPFGFVMISSEVFHDVGFSKEHPGTISHQQERIVEPSKKAYDKRVFGIYAGRFSKEKHQIYGVGDGYVLVCSEGGDIEKGDFITSSNKTGHGMKQNDDLMHNYTIAKSEENVNWSKEKKKVKLIACTYHAS